MISVYYISKYKENYWDRALCRAGWFHHDIWITSTLYCILLHWRRCCTLNLTEMALWLANNHLSRTQQIASFHFFHYSFLSLSRQNKTNPHLNIIIETGCPANIHRICQTISGRRVFWEQLFVYLWMSDLNTLPPAAPCYVIDFHDHSESHDNIRGSTGLVSQYNNIISGMAGRTEEAFREGGGWSS